LGVHFEVDGFSIYGDWEGGGYLFGGGGGLLDII